MPRLSGVPRVLRSAASVKSAVGMSATATVAAGALLWRERRAMARMERLGAAALETLLNAIDANDSVTGAHVRRVARYALVLARAADLDEHVCHSVERIALFHDIGKIHEALFDVIHEETSLTPAERRAINTHPQRGADVLAPLATFYPDLPDGVLSHHERWDGTGYPRKLRGARIPFAARVVAIADTFDAVTHKRRYSHARSFASAIGAIAAGRGRQFDPELVDLFMSVPVLKEIRREMVDANRKRPANGARGDRGRSGDELREERDRSRKESREGHGHSRKESSENRDQSATESSVNHKRSGNDSGRRHPSGERSATPDVMFRWRDTAPPPPREGPARRKSPQ